MRNAELLILMVISVFLFVEDYTIDLLLFMIENLQKGISNICVDLSKRILKNNLFLSIK